MYNEYYINLINKYLYELNNNIHKKVTLNKIKSIKFIDKNNHCWYITGIPKIRKNRKYSTTESIYLHCKECKLNISLGIETFLMYKYSTIIFINKVNNLLNEYSHFNCYDRLVKNIIL